MKHLPHDSPVVALDLDGTLLRDDKTVSEFTRSTLRRLAKEGVKIMFVTGRRERIALPVIEALDVPGWALFTNGTMAIEWPSRHRCLTHYMPRPFLADVVACLDHLDRAPIMLVDPNGSPVDILMHPRMLALDVYRQYAEHHQAFVALDDSLLANPMIDRVLGMFLCEPEDDLARFTKRLARMMGGAINHRALENSAYLTGHRILEIIEPTWTKWTGITEIIAQFSDEPSRIYAFGDDRNDLDMLTNADVSFAPANAVDAAKQAAAEVIPSNNNDGVAVTLRRVFAHLLD